MNSLNIIIQFHKDYQRNYNISKYFKYPIKALYKLNFKPKLLYLRYFGSDY